MKKFFSLACFMIFFSLASCNSAQNNTFNSSSESKVKENSELLSENSNQTPESTEPLKKQEFNIEFLPDVGDSNNTAPLESSIAYVTFSMDIPSTWIVSENYGQYVITSDTNSSNYLALIQGDVTIIDKSDPFKTIKNNVETDSPTSITKEFTLNGRDVFLVVYEGTPEGSGDSYSYFVDMGNGILMCEFNIDNLGEVNTEICESIISSIKHNN